MARKKKSIAAVSNDAAALLQKLVRVKAADMSGYCRCVTCGRVEHYTDMDGGHFISRTWTATRLMEKNIHPQCKRCNGYLRGNMIAYTLYMVETYGKDFVEELQRIKNVPTKYTRADLLDMIDLFRDRVAEIMTEKGL